MALKIYHKIITSVSLCFENFERVCEYEQTKKRKALCPNEARRTFLLSFLEADEVERLALIGVGYSYIAFLDDFPHKSFNKMVLRHFYCV